MIKIDVSAEMDTQALSDCVSAVGGVSIDVDKPVNLGKYTLSDGKRKLTGSVAQMLANDGAAYSENRLDSALAYRRFLPLHSIRLTAWAGQRGFQSSWT